LSHSGDCRVCNLKERCTRAPFRKLARDINEEARDHARSLKGTPEYEQSRNERKKVEMRSAHLRFITKRWDLPVLAGLRSRDEALVANGNPPMGDLTNALDLSTSVSPAPTIT
jgi:phospholipase C